MEEKYSIKITEKGVVIIGRNGARIDFSASEALMVLEILQAEEEELRKIADASSPLPIRYRFDSE